MRMSAWIMIVVLVVGSSHTVLAAGKNKRKPEDPAAARSASIDAAAEIVFHKADKNHNDLLSSVEFHKSQTMLEAAIVELAQDGKIGGKPAGNSKAGKNAPAGPAAPAAVDNSIFKSNRITLQEFTAYAHAVADQADAALAQARREYESRQKYLHDRYRRGNYYRRMYWAPPTDGSPLRNLVVVVDNGNLVPAAALANGATATSGQAGVAVGSPVSGGVPKTFVLGDNPNPLDGHINAFAGGAPIGINPNPLSGHIDAFNGAAPIGSNPNQPSAAANASHEFPQIGNRSLATGVKPAKPHHANAGQAAHHVGKPAVASPPSPPAMRKPKK